LDREKEVGRASVVEEAAAEAAKAADSGSG